MKSDWLKFVILRLPLMLVLLGGLVELAAYNLRNAPLLRHPLDELVYSMTDQQVDAPIVLMGDSVTQDVAGTYAVAPVGQVANLTTNQASGVLGASFLLQRYLSRNAPPEKIVIASTPEFFTRPTPGPAVETYLTSVFTHSEERSVLSQQGLLRADPFWRPAILNFDARVFDRVVGLVFARPSDILAQGADPWRIPDPKDRTVTGEFLAALSGRKTNVLILDATAAAGLRTICRAATELGAELHIAWAPAPASVVEMWRGAAAVQGLQQQIGELGSGECTSVHFRNFNDLQDFPDQAFRDPDHLHRPGWTAQYARLLWQAFE